MENSSRKEKKKLEKINKNTWKHKIFASTDSQTRRDKVVEWMQFDTE